MRSQTIATQSVNERDWRAAPVDSSGWLTSSPGRGSVPDPRAGTAGEPARDVPPLGQREDRNSAARVERRAARARRLRKARARVHRAAMAKPEPQPVEATEVSSAASVDPIPARSEGYRVGRWARLALTMTALAAVVVITVSLVGGSAPTAFVDVTVGPGDTLWSIAQSSSPDRDPRAVIEEIRQLNDVPTDVLPIGIVLRVPSSTE
jgi:LysM repeat protein